MKTKRLTHKRWLFILLSIGILISVVGIIHAVRKYQYESSALRLGSSYDDMLDEYDEYFSRIEYRPTDDRWQIMGGIGAADGFYWVWITPEQKEALMDTLLTDSRQILDDTMEAYPEYFEGYEFNDDFTQVKLFCRKDITADKRPQSTYEMPGSVKMRICLYHEFTGLISNITDPFARVYV